MRAAEQKRSRRSGRSSVRGVVVLAVLTAFLAVAGVSALAAGAGAGAGTRLAAGTQSAAGVASKRVHAWATYYGWYDNTPPGCKTAYSGCAHGKGTYGDPITFASYQGEFPVGTIIYYPTVHKYFRMGDSCGECEADWKGHGPDGGPHMYHVDLWTGGKGGNEFDAINCEDALTQQKANGSPKLTTFIVDPPDNLKVSSQPLFKTSTGRCFGDAKTTSTTGTYRNKASGRCLTGPAHRGARVTMSKCSNAADRIVFDGAFFVKNKQCMKVSGSKDGSQLVWARCDGDPYEQWEVSSNHTLTWMQYVRCIADRHGRVIMTKCTPGPTERWKFTSTLRAGHSRSADAVQSTTHRSAVVGDRSPSAATRRAVRVDASSKAVKVYATYYGYYDNTPPSCTTAYGTCAGGTGTYADPITFASDTAEFPKGTVLYYPTVQKYFVMGDDCQECDEDWTGQGPDGGPHMYHVDLWTGGKGGNAFDAINCEDALTLSDANGNPLMTTFIENPPSNKPVSSQPLFDASTNSCFGGAQATGDYGTYQNQGDGKCLSGPTSWTNDATMGSCSSSAAENIEYIGAFFVKDNQCLKTAGSSNGSQMYWAGCDGDPDEQWEVNPNDTLTWMQFTRCLADDDGNVVMDRCNAGAHQLWNFTESGGN